MLKNTFKIIVKKYGKPLYINACKSSLDYFNADHYVEISWGASKNLEIINNHFSYGQAFIITWRVDKQIHLKRFRQNGSKVTAEKRAKDYVQKLNRWASSNKK